MSINIDMFMHQNYFITFLTSMRLVKCFIVSGSKILLITFLTRVTYRRKFFCVKWIEAGVGRKDEVVEVELRRWYNGNINFRSLMKVFEEN